jgi:isopentenyl-diphosphate delta-isomerase
MDAPEHVILVNERNERVGTAEKLEAHRFGLLHRAFSVFLVDDKTRILLQRRHAQKYHSGDLWANSCCGHPRPAEATLRAAQRRVFEELGTSSPLRLGFRARYRVDLDNGLVENEIVYVFFGRYNGECAPNPAEVSGTELCSLSGLSGRSDLASWLNHYIQEHPTELARCIEEVAQ